MGGSRKISLPSAPTRVSCSGLKLRSPAMANAVTSSGDVTKACVAGLPSLRAAKFRLYEVTIELASPAGQLWVTSACPNLGNKPLQHRCCEDGLQSLSQRARRRLTLLDLRALPLADAGPACVCQNCPAHLLKHVQDTIAGDGGPDLLTARRDGEWDLQATNMPSH